MTALLIIAGIVLLFAVLLNCPVRAKLSYLDGVPAFSVWYLCFKVYPLKEKKPKKKRKKRIKKQNSTEIEQTSDKRTESEDNKPVRDEREQEKASVSDRLRDKLDEVRAENAAEDDILTDGKKPDKLGELKETVEKVKLVWNASKGGVRHLFRHIKIYDISLDIVTADEDAYEAAMKYGRMNSYVYGGIALLRTFFTISLKKINIQCKFNSTQSRYNLSCTVTVTPSTALLTALSVLTKYLLLTVPDRLRQRASQPNK